MNRIALLCALLLFSAAFSVFSCGDDDDDDGGGQATEDDDDAVDDDATDDDATDDDAADDDATDDDATDDDATDDDATDDDMDFAGISAGTFSMGSYEDELGRQNDETRHSVTLTNDFEVSVTEVTQGRFTMLMGWNPSYWGPNGPGEECGDDCPADQMSWYDALAFANELSFDAGYLPCYSLASVICVDGTDAGADYMGCMSVAGGGIDSATVTLNAVTSVYECGGYRLLTESEYEYATRAGTTSAFYNGGISFTDCTLDPNADAIGWYCGNTDAPQPVRQKAPNAWGLYDMSGNAWEWNWDWYDAYPGETTDPEGPLTGTERTLGGGSYYDGAGGIRSAIRGKIGPSLRYGGVGFRVARSLEPATTGFRRIFAGSFTMGSPTDELERNEDETQHTVTLTNNFEMSLYETSQGEFTSLMGWNPSHFGPSGGGDDCGDDCPVEHTTWYEAVAYANEFSADAGYGACYRLSNVVCEDDTSVGANYMGCMNGVQQGIQSASVSLNGVTSVYDCEGFRLPTESEWEYAIRAGTTTAFYNGPITNPECEPLDPYLDDIGWYCGNAGSLSKEIGQKLPNSWGLYDMSGNVGEWNWDWWDDYPGTATDPEGSASGLYRVFRGGGWFTSAKLCRSASRECNTPGFRDGALGFRLARTLP